MTGTVSPTTTDANCPRERASYLECGFSARASSAWNAILPRAGTITARTATIIASNPERTETTHDSPRTSRPNNAPTQNATRTIEMTDLRKATPRRPPAAIVTGCRRVVDARGQSLINWAMSPLPGRRRGSQIHGRTLGSSRSVRTRSDSSQSAILGCDEFRHRPECCYAVQRRAARRALPNDPGSGRPQHSQRDLRNRSGYRS